MSRHGTPEVELEYETNCHCCRCWVCTNEPPWWMEDPWCRAFMSIMVIGFAALGVFASVLYAIN